MLLLILLINVSPTFKLKHVLKIFDIMILFCILTQQLCFLVSSVTGAV